MTNANTPRAMIGSIPVFCAYDDIIPTAKAVPNPQNPNRHPDKQINLLAEIIKQQGWRAPITISNRSGYIVRGHGRLMAARLLGAESVPVDFQNYESDAAEKADMIADNRIAEFSDLDDDILSELLEQIQDGDLDMELTGFDFDELEKYITIADEAINDANADTNDAITSFSFDPPEEIFAPDTSQPPINPVDFYSNPDYENELHKKQGQTGEISLSDYAEERYAHECPKCKFKW